MDNNTDMIEIYFETDVWKYDTEKGTMECPPFVQTVGDIHSYFGNAPHAIVGEVPQRLRSTRVPRWSDWQRRRTLADDGWIEFLGRAEQDEEEERSRKRLEVRIRERKAHREKTVLIGRRSVVPLYHCYDNGGERIAGYHTLREAAEAVGCTIDTLRKAIGKPRRRSAGMRWIKAEIPPRRIEPFEERKAMPRTTGREIPCSRYDADGKRLGTWDSYKEASEATGLSRTAICSAVNGTIMLLDGYRWRKGDAESIEPMAQSRRPRRTECSCYDAEGVRVATYPSFGEAARAVGLSRSSIGFAVLGGGGHLAAGLRWRKGHEERIEAANSRV